jgi:hypothetical protein
MINKDEVARIIKSYLPEAGEDVLQRLTEYTVQDAVVAIYSTARRMSTLEQLQQAEE